MRGKASAEMDLFCNKMQVIGQSALWVGGKILGAEERNYSCKGKA